MRRVLVDYARGRNRLRRGDGIAPLSLDDVAVLFDGRAEQLIAINAALENLTTLDSRKSKVFEMRYFGGMSVEEVAEAVDVEVGCTLLPGNPRFASTR